jgi:hypothetical protein
LLLGASFKRSLTDGELPTGTAPAAPVQLDDVIDNYSAEGKWTEGNLKVNVE